MEPVEIMLKEYEMIRQEVLASMANRTSILSFGLATIGAIFTASIATYTVSTYALLSSLMLIFAVPAINSFILYMWMGEYKRMQRAGHFLFELEERVNKEVRGEVLSWEHHLRSKHLHMNYPYYMTVALLVVISVISLSLGLITLQLSTNAKWIIGVSGSALYLFILIFTVVHIRKLHL
jgi:hypothetical protein